MHEELKSLFKKYKLGVICKVIKCDYKWAFGDVYVVTTWLNKYIIHERDGHVESIKNNKKYFYKKGEIE